ncbi:MAG: S8 family peptidase [Halobacteriales archaeon]
MRATAGAVVVGGVGLSAGGTVAAEDGGDRFIVVGTPNVDSRIEKEGFEIVQQLADGEVLIVGTARGQQDNLEAVNGVQHAVPVRKVEYSDPPVEGEVATESADEEAEDQFDEPLFWEQQWDKRLLDVSEAHETATGDGVRVAVIDTGIEPHLDLDPNLNEELSVRFKNGEKVREGDPHDARPGGHGTQVAGIIASSGLGTVGVAPDAELVSINLFQEDLSGTALWTVTDLLVSMEYAREIEADVINMSLLSLAAPQDSGSRDETEIRGLRAALERLTNVLAREGIVMTASAGNFGENIQTGGEWWFPGGQNGVLNVSATGPNDKLAYYSNYGSRWIDIAAPGGGYETVEKTFCTQDGLILGCEDVDDDPPVPVDDCECEPAELPANFNLILSTSPMEPPPGSSAVWGRFSGTSAAAPQVAGVAALVKEANSDLNARGVEQVLKRSAEFVRGQGDPEFGAGRVNAADAVDLATK